MVSTKPMRSSVACELCRNSKLKCLNNNDNSPCHRCNLHGLECVYTLKKSQLKKKRLKRYIDCSKEIVPEKDSQTTYNVILPDKQSLIEVAELYFDNQYKGIFPIIHKPYFLSFLRSDEFDPETYMKVYYTNYFKGNYTISLRYPDPVIILAILALCARLHPTLPKLYGEFSEVDSPEAFTPSFHNMNYKQVDNKDNNAASNASNYFGWHARRILKEVFDSPTIQRVQALTILSSHEWGEGNASRSYLYVGIAARMALVLGLGSEEGLYDSKHDSQLDESARFISVESKRRTMWAVYMMDRCNSLGRERSSCIRLDEIHIKLPCEEKDYMIGNFHLESLTVPQVVEYMNDPVKRPLLAKTSCVGFLIVLLEIWSKIAKWAGELGGRMEKLPPWEKESTYYKLSKELDLFVAGLPMHLQFSKFNLEAHIADGSAADFGYFHGLYYICRIFLCREYLFCSPESFPDAWFPQLTRLLLLSIDDLVHISRTLMPLNLMVIAPFTGFQVFTAAATSLYFNAFPSKFLEKAVDNTTKVKEKYKQLAEESIEQILTWRRYWGLGRSWYENCWKLKNAFETFSRGRPAAIEEDDTVQHTLRDYGNGKVQEVYKPEYVHDSKKNMLILSLLISETDSNPRDAHLSIPELLSPDFAAIGSPALDFMSNLDFSVFTGWGETMKMKNEKCIDI